MLVNRLPLPAGGAPDLVLLAVVGAALLRGPVAGAVIGFCAGLLVTSCRRRAHLVGAVRVRASRWSVTWRGAAPAGRVATVVLCVLLAPCWRRRSAGCSPIRG